MTFDQAFDALMVSEGGYVSHPSDPGGATNFGITQKVALQEGYMGDMRFLSRATAADIYRRRYWNAIRAEDLPEPLRFAVFDAAVNSGVTQAVKWLQRVLGVGDDGVIGPVTLKAAKSCDAVKCAAKFHGERLDFMTSLPTWAAFGRGWARRIASNLKEM